MIDNDAIMLNEEGGAFVYMGEGGPRVPYDVVRVRVHPSVTIIPDRAFQDRNKLEEVELYEGLLEIGKYAFDNCISLKRVKIPSTVTLIGDGAFTRCKKMEKIEVLEGIEEIGRLAFSDCKSLKHIHIPTTIKKIGVRAFRWVPLSSIDLPDGMESIGAYTFVYCKFNRLTPNSSEYHVHP